MCVLHAMSTQAMILTHTHTPLSRRAQTRTLECFKSQDGLIWFRQTDAQYAQYGGVAIVPRWLRVSEQLIH